MLHRELGDDGDRRRLTSVRTAFVVQNPWNAENHPAPGLSLAQAASGQWSGGSACTAVAVHSTEPAAPRMGASALVCDIRAVYLGGEDRPGAPPGSVRPVRA
ncbi:hypothetical protein GCM10027269_22610 [Kribbella endophytica]